MTARGSCAAGHEATRAPAFLSSLKYSSTASGSITTLSGMGHDQTLDHLCMCLSSCRGLTRSSLTADVWAVHA